MGVAVTFEHDNAIVQVEPGQQASCSIRVENTGMVVDSMLLDVLGDAAQWAAVEPAQLNLLPGASASAKIVFQPPRAPSCLPGEVPFGLRAMSTEDPDGSQIEEGVVNVAEFSDLEAGVVPTTATGSRSAHFRLVLENRGNRYEHVIVDANDADAKLSFRARPAAVSAAPGTATYVRVTALPRKRFIRGPNRALPFEIVAQPEDDQAVSANATMLQRQLLPRWLLPLLGLAVLAAGLLIALWLTVLEPVVHSAATAAADANKAAKSAKSAASEAAKTPAPTPPSALDVTIANPTILTHTTELAGVTGSYLKGGSGSLPNLVWTSSNPKVAKVSQTGVVTAVKPGAATITATGTTTAPTPSPSAQPSPGVAGAAKTQTGPTPDGTLLSTRSAGQAVLSGSVTVNVVGAVTISSTALPEAAAGKPYSQPLTASGGTGAFTWTISGGALPPGLSLSPGGSVTGTPTRLGSTKFKVHLADAGPPAQFTARTLTIDVVKPLAVDTSALPGGTVGDTYAQPLAAVGGTPPYKWSLAPGDGSLPAGLVLNAKTGAIKGTPTATGDASFMVQVADAASPGQTSSEALSVNVVSPLVFSTLTVPSGVFDSSYSQELTAFGGVGPYVWSVSSGNLPNGLSLNPTTGALSGTPEATGSSNFTIQVTDSSKPGQSVSRSFTMSVVDAFGVTTTSLTQGSVGISYSAQLTAAGGATPYVWTLTGTLPPGLMMSPDGVISGTPTSTGVFPFTVQAVDGGSPPLSATSSLSITVVSPLRITTKSLPEAVTGSNYSQVLSTTGGTSPLSWSVTSGSLPAGLSLDSDSGAISGTPLTIGSSNFTVSVTDSATPTAATATLSTSITVVEPLTFNEPALPDAVQGDEYVTQIPDHVSGGSGSYTWYITSGTLPAGMSLDAATGAISGGASASSQTGVQNFTLTLADSNDPSLTFSRAESITVNAALTVVPTELTDTAGQSFSQDLSSLVNGGVGPYTFTASPLDGMPVDPTTGVVSGTPDAPCLSESVSGSNPVVVTCPSVLYTTQLTVSDSYGDSVTVTISLSVQPAALKFVPASSLNDVHLDSGYSDNVTVNGALPTGGYGGTVGGVGGYSFSTSHVSGPANNNGLPCNLDTCSTGDLSMDSQTGHIGGELTATPSLGTTWTFNVTITDTDPANTAFSISYTFQLSIELTAS